MQHGGKRPGAGKPKGSISKKTKEKRLQEAMAREHIVKYYLSRWEEFERTAAMLALGEIQVVEINGKKLRVYSKPPDSKMLQDVIETVIGRPKQEVSGAIDLPQLTQLAANVRAILEKK